MVECITFSFCITIPNNGIRYAEGRTIRVPVTLSVVFIYCRDDSASETFLEI